MKFFETEKGIRTGDKFFTWNELKSISNWPAEVPDICRNWLQGKDSFELMSSGSTGEASTVVFSREALIRSVEASKKALNLGAYEHALCAITPEKTGGMMLLVRCMHLDLDCTLLRPASDPMESLSEDHPCTITSLVPFQLQRILLNPTSLEKLKRFKQVLIGGAALESSVLHQINEFQTEFIHTYGMTETASHIALRRLNGPHKEPYFYPMGGTMIRLDERGCLCVQSEVIDEKWICTNDQVAIHADGGFEVLGRADFVINSGGVKIHPERVEAILEEWMFKHGYRLEIMAAAEPDPLLGERLVLICTQQPPWQLNDIPDELFPPYHKPRALRVQVHLPRTDTGKLLRK